MDRCALFVDAGYALADGAMAVHGTRRRDSVSWDHAGLLKLLAGLARDRTGLPVLRCYWYETAEGRTAEHDALAEMPGLKLRLVNARPGRREGIESQVRRDLVTLAKSGAISDAFIASADEHLAEIVSEVQDLGLRVVVLHITSDNGWTIPQPLRQECDDIVEISGVHLRPFVDLIRGAEPSPPQDHSYRGASAVTNSDESLAGSPSGGALSRTGLPAQALPAAVGAYQPAEAGSGYASSAQHSYEGIAGQSAAAAAYQAAPVARQAGGAPSSGGGGHHAAHAASAAPSAQYGQSRGDQEHASDGQVNGGAQFGRRLDDQVRDRDGAANGAVQAGQAHDVADQPGAGQAGNSGQFPVLANGNGQPGAGQAGNSGQFPVLANGNGQPGAGQAGNSSQMPVLPPDAPASGTQGNSPVNGQGQYSQGQAGGAYGGAAVPGGSATGAAANGGSASGGGPATGGAGGSHETAGNGGFSNGGFSNGGFSNGGTARGGQGEPVAGYSDLGRPAQPHYPTGPQQTFDGQSAGAANSAPGPVNYQTPAAQAGYHHALPGGYQAGPSQAGQQGSSGQNGAQNGGAQDAVARNGGTGVSGSYQRYQPNGGLPGGHPANGGTGGPGPDLGLKGGASASAANSGQFPVMPSAGQPGRTHAGPAANGNGQYRAGEANGVGVNGRVVNGGLQDGGLPAAGGANGYAAGGGAAAGAANGYAAGGGSGAGGADGYAAGGAGGANGYAGGANGYGGAGGHGYNQDYGAAYGGSASSSGPANVGGGANGSGPGNSSAMSNGAQNPAAGFQAAPTQPGQGQPGHGQPAPGQPGPAQPPVVRQGPLPGQLQPYYPANPNYAGGQIVGGQVVANRDQVSLPVPARGGAPAYPPYPAQPYQPQQNQSQHNQSQHYQSQHYQQYQPQQPSAVPAVRPAQPVAVSLPDAVKAAHNEGFTFGESVSRDAPGLWLEAVLARKPRMPSDLEARLLQGSVLPIDSLLHDEVRHSLRRGFWDALESARR